MSQLSLMLALLAFYRQNKDAAIQLWLDAVAFWEAGQKLVNGASETFGQIMPRDAGAALTPDEEDAERQFAEAFGSPRGAFGNGRILRWMLTTDEGKAVLATLLSKIPGFGS